MQVVPAAGQSGHPPNGTNRPRQRTGPPRARHPRPLTDEDATREVLDDAGWLRTGDLGRLDEGELRAFGQEQGIGDDLGELRDHAAVHREVEAAVERANGLVSQAEAVREFRILDREFSLEQGELTPTMKPRRPQIAEHFADELEEIYA